VVLIFTRLLSQSVTEQAKKAAWRENLYPNRFDKTAQLMIASLELNKEMTEILLNAAIAFLETLWSQLYHPNQL